MPQVRAASPWAGSCSCNVRRKKEMGHNLSNMYGTEWEPTLETGRLEHDTMRDSIGTIPLLGFVEHASDIPNPFLDLLRRLQLDCFKWSVMTHSRLSFCPWIRKVFQKGDVRTFFGEEDVLFLREMLWAFHTVGMTINELCMNSADLM